MTLSSNKETALDFLHLITSGNPRKAFELHTTSEFIHHNPHFKNDPESLIMAMEEDLQKHPHKIFRVLRSLEEGPLVAIHSSVHQHENDPGVAIVHIFRFHAGKILEFWDIAQPIPSDIINESGMF